MLFGSLRSYTAIAGSSTTEGRRSVERNQQKVQRSPEIPTTDNDSGHRDVDAGFHASGVSATFAGPDPNRRDDRRPIITPPGVRLAVGASAVVVLERYAKLRTERGRAVVSKVEVLFDHLSHPQLAD